MLNVTFAITALVLSGGDPYADRPRNPVAPSLPLLSEKENAKLEAVVNRFIQYETGKLSKAEEQKAKDDLYRLGPEATFALVEGFNRALQMESSCATVTIGKKIESIVRASKDQDLIAYVKENIGAGVDRNSKRSLPATNSMRNVQTTCLLRKGELLRRGLAMGARPAPAKLVVSSMSMSDLEKAAAKERGDRLQKVLTEVERRQGYQAPDILGKAAAGADPEGRKLAKVLLVNHAEKQSPSQLKMLLKHDNAEVRAAAARTVGSKELRYGDELIALLGDDNAGVREAARGALVRLSDCMDFGPEPNASVGNRNAAVQRWRQWWQTASRAP
jgi:hypothetical protein